MTETQIRPFEPTDTPGVLRVLAESMTGDAISETRFTRQVLLDPNFRAEGAPVALDGADVVGFCLSIARHTPLENAPSDADRGYVTLMGVRPDAQRRGVGTQLLQHAETYLKAQNRSLVMISPYAPGYFAPGVDVNDYAPALSFFKKHGYAEVYRPISMQVPLWNLSTPEWVKEKARPFQIKPFEPAFTLPLLDFAAREFQGDWVRVVRETAGKILSGDSPTRLITAFDGDQIVGFSHHDNERFGPIGVAASQRGRGIGQVLMYATLRAQRDAGFRTAWFLWSDDKTAERLYNAAGFKEVRRFALLKKPL